MHTPTMTIGGQAAGSTSSLEVDDPATGRTIGHAPDCSAAEAGEAMAAATEAFTSWRSDRARRRAALLAAAAVLKAAVDDLATLVTVEQGKPLREARGEVLGAAATFRYYSRVDPSVEVVQDDDVATVEVHRRPIGAVVAITPWNFPLALAAFKVAPALAAGNTVVLKPSPFTPLSTLRLGELLRAELPPGVLNVVSGRDPLGELLTHHELTRKISFTGSVASGRAVAAAAAADFKRVTLELGGNDPAIVLDDVDPGAVADAMFWSAFGNCGQVCSAIKRVYVPESLYAPFVEAMAAKAASLTLGHGLHDETQLGPLNNDRQRDRVNDLVQAAIASGARTAAGGHAVEGPGRFYEPTILAKADDGMAIVDEEQFGPALPIIAYRDVDDAVARANATPFGLGASVWATDVARAAQIGESIEAGTLWINAHWRLGRDQPYGGLKASGIGLEHGRWGYEGFTEAHVVYRAAS